ncbi:MAG: peptidylprolyl isomerase [DPANN group archaeon]|nr:peptidylprolyl isomerase [DPANN group archaeon]
MAVKEGDKVKVHYTGTLDDGTAFDSSEGKDPLEFQVGAHQVIPGFEDGVIGMEKGAEKTIDIPSEKAYGNQNPQLIQKVPRDKIPADQKVEAGMMMGVGLPDGNQIPAKVTAVDDKEITIDMNHPLAGKNLHFKVKMEEYTEGRLEKKKADACCGGSCVHDGDDDKKEHKCDSC